MSDVARSLDVVVADDGSVLWPPIGSPSSAQARAITSSW